MVTPLESGALLEHFSIIFTLLLVMVVVYGIMQWSRMLGENKGLHLLIALILGLFVIMIPEITELLSVMIPWFVLLFIFLIMIIMAYKIFGATDEDIMSALKVDRTLIWVVIIISVLIAVGSFSSVYGQKLLGGDGGEVAEGGEEDTVSASSGSFSQNVGATLFHPKVIGLIFIFLVAVFALAILGAATRAE
ncbi:MAG: hypothetical protein R6U32_02455 [Candidatus Woesearchaeota archaeon]